MGEGGEMMVASGSVPVVMTLASSVCSSVNVAGKARSKSDGRPSWPGALRGASGSLAAATL